jgi:hypothetical protein
LGDGTKPFWAQIKVVVDTGIVYDFVAKSPEAVWKSGAGNNLDTDLVFGGDDNDPNGVAKIKDNVELESGTTSGKLLFTYPKQDGDGVVAGLYPVHLVQQGDHLIARLGFMMNPDGTCGAGRVRFQIGYKEGDEIIPLGEWTKSCDGRLKQIDINLSELKGKTVQFFFAVGAEGSSQDDWAIWNSPRIER